MFTVESIHARMHQQPFGPLRIVTSAGESYNVVHPDLIIESQRVLEIGVPAKSETTIGSHIHRVALLHITAVNDLAVSASSGTNGAA